MTTWNYRVLHHIHEPSGEEMLAIHEVYYDEGGSPKSCTINPVTVTSVKTDTSGLRWTLEKMLEALDRPVLEYNSLGETRLS